MMKYLLRIMPLVLMFAMNPAAAQPLLKYQVLGNGDLVRWVYAEGDEFDGNRLDENVWRTSYPWGRTLAGNKEQQFYHPENVSVEGGLLNLITRRETVYDSVEPWRSGKELMSDGKPNARSLPFTSGMIFSLHTFLYGLFEIRFKVPATKGLWPAFWLYGGQPNEEIDFFELKGENAGKIHLDAHGQGRTFRNFGGWVESLPSFSDNFHVMAGEWNPGFVRWHLDGQQVGLFYGQLHIPEFLILNTAVASPCPAAFCPGPDPQTKLPATFEIDYVRIFQQQTSPARLVINSNKLTQAPGIVPLPTSPGTITIPKKNEVFTKSRKARKLPISRSFVNIGYHSGKKELWVQVTGERQPGLTLTISGRNGQIVRKVVFRDEEIQNISLQGLATGLYTLNTVLQQHEISDILEIR